MKEELALASEIMPGWIERGFGWVYTHHRQTRFILMAIATYQFASMIIPNRDRYEVKLQDKERELLRVQNEAQYLLRRRQRIIEALQASSTSSTALDEEQLEAALNPSMEKMTEREEASETVTQESTSVSEEIDSMLDGKGAQVSGAPGKKSSRSFII